MNEEADGSFYAHGRINMVRSALCVAVRDARRPQGNSGEKPS